MSKRIVVKTVAEPFRLSWHKQKFSELRLDDGKDYMIGDLLVQQEWGPRRGYSGRFVMGRISAITRVGHWIHEADYRWVILHIDPVTFGRGKALMIERTFP